MIERLCKEGPVTVHLQMDAHMEADVEAGNVMGEIVGSEHPEQVVAIGGHIDSWDVGQGAQDDGSGIMAAYQAVTLIHKLGLKPKRTIRLVFWVNEENGGAGGRAYRKMVGDKIGDQVAAIEMDEGAEKPLGMGYGNAGSDRGRPRVRLQASARSSMRIAAGGGAAVGGGDAGYRFAAGADRGGYGFAGGWWVGYRAADGGWRSGVESADDGGALLRLAPHGGGHAGQGRSGGVPEKCGDACRWWLMCWRIWMGGSWDGKLRLQSNFLAIQAVAASLRRPPFFFCSLNTSADVEADALGERKVGAVVDGVGGAAHVLLPGVGAGFAAAAGFFFAAEGSADLCAGGADVDVGDAAVGAGGGEEVFGFAEVQGEDGGGEALGDVVLQRDGFVEVGVLAGRRGWGRRFRA